MKTAAVILNYNDAQGTVDAVKRINGFFCFDSIVVVDNASSDNSAELIKLTVDSLNAAESFTDSDVIPNTAGSSHNGGSSENAAAGGETKNVRDHEIHSRNSRERIHFIRSGRNGGYGSGNNLGVRYAAEHCGAELAVIANPDAEFDEGLIKSMQLIFENEADAAAVGAVMTGQTGSTHNDGTFTYDEYVASGWKRRGTAGCVINCCPVLRRVFKRAINFSPEYYCSTYAEALRQSGRQRKAEKYISINKKTKRGTEEKKTGDCICSMTADQTHTDAVEVYAVHGSLLMVSVPKFIEAGGYDEHMFLYCEENTLAEKLYRRGYKSFLLKAGYKHAGSVSISGSGLKAAARQRIRNASERYYYRHYLGCGRAAMHAVRMVQAIVMAETYAAAFLHLI